MWPSAPDWVYGLALFGAAGFGALLALGLVAGAVWALLKMAD